MKRTISFILAVTFILSLSLSVGASFANSTVIIDAAQDISSSAYYEIDEQLKATREEYLIDCVYVSTYDNAQADIEQNADIFYNAGGYGYGEDKDGIMLYLSLTQMKYTVRTYGIAQDIIDVDDVYSEIDPYLADGNYEGAAFAFAYTCEDLLAFSDIDTTSANSSGSVDSKAGAQSDAPGFENYPVFDEAGLLTDAEYYELTDRLEEIRNKFSTDVAFVTTAQLVSETAQASADDIFDYSGYGYGSEKQGILLYICSDSRLYALSTHGDDTIKKLNDDAIEYIEEKMLPLLKQDDYAGAAMAYAEACDMLLQTAADGKPYEAPKSVASIILTYVIAIAIAAAIAFFMMKNKLAQMKTATAKKEANDYVKPGSMNVTFANDIFLYSNVTQTAKPKNNDSSSSTHTSSSGETHGGSSGSF